MNQAFLLSAVALAAAVIVLMNQMKDPFRIAAVAVAGVEVLVALGIIKLSIAGLSLGLVLGGALCGLGVFLWLRNSAKLAVSGCAIMALIGALQVLGALR